MAVRKDHIFLTFQHILNPFDYNIQVVFEKWGAYGNAERRTQHWRQQVTPIGKSMSDTWQTTEFAKRFTLAEVWKEWKIDDKTTLPGRHRQGA